MNITIFIRYIKTRLSLIMPIYTNNSFASVNKSIFSTNEQKSTINSNGNIDLQNVLFVKTHSIKHYKLHKTNKQ